jgi:hypothetical protein
MHPAELENLLAGSAQLGQVVVFDELSEEQEVYEVTKAVIAPPSAGVSVQACSFWAIW